MTDLRRRSSLIQTTEKQQPFLAKTKRTMRRQQAEAGTDQQRRKTPMQWM